MAYLNTAAGTRRESGSAGLAAIADLTAASGTADGTVADGTGTYSQTITNNNNQEFATKINLILARMRANGDIASS